MGPGDHECDAVAFPSAFDGLASGDIGTRIALEWDPLENLWRAAQDLERRIPLTRSVRDTVIRVLAATKQVVSGSSCQLVRGRTHFPICRPCSCQTRAAYRTLPSASCPIEMASWGIFDEPSIRCHRTRGTSWPFDSAAAYAAVLARAARSHSSRPFPSVNSRHAPRRIRSTSGSSWYAQTPTPPTRQIRAPRSSSRSAAGSRAASCSSRRAILRARSSSRDVSLLYVGVYVYSAPIGGV